MTQESFHKNHHVSSYYLLPNLTFLCSYSRTILMKQANIRGGRFCWLMGQRCYATAKSSARKKRKQEKLKSRLKDFIFALFVMKNYLLLLAFCLHQFSCSIRLPSKQDTKKILLFLSYSPFAELMENCVS